MASSAFSSPSFRNTKHEVFLSFRGEDTRNGFLYHLYEALRRKGIEAYADFKQLQRGDEISDALSKAIEHSMISTIVFSQNYASSTWCLEELSHIMECRRCGGQLVIPIFYHVNPSDIRKQTGSFEKAFVDHEKNGIHKVGRWRNALTEAGNLSGFHLKGDEPEPKVIEKIVRDILSKLNRLSKSDSNGLIGIGLQMEQIKSLLCLGGQDVRIIGIWGMAGIGKSTLAQAIYYELSAQFESCCFQANVREESQKHGAITLRDKLLSKVLNDKNLHIDTPTILPTSTKDRLRRKRILLVLDDVTDWDQLGISAISHDYFGFGSKIIVTSRDKQVLENGSVDDIYEVKELNYRDSLQLFSLFAFKQNHVVEEFQDLSNKMLEYAGGVPLALKVLGSRLYKKSIAEYKKRIEDWESVLNSLKQYGNLEIQNVLKISFDGLDEVEKNIFLDIAFFFKGYDRDHATKLLDGCYGTAQCGITNLIDKCLLNVTEGNILAMHDLLQEMGKNVVRLESKRPEERSRLWTPHDVRQVLKNGTGTKLIEGISLNLSEMDEKDEIQLHPCAFETMPYLKILKIYNAFEKRDKLVLSEQGLKFLPNELRYFHWEKCILKAFPTNFCLENLVELRLGESNIEQLWNGDQRLGNLRVLDLEVCKNLTRIPNLSAAINIEELLFRRCKRLVQLPELPRHRLGNLRVLDLDFCKNLTRIPNLSAAINIERLKFSWCKSLVEVPSLIHLKSLHTHLFVQHCNSLKKFPELPRHLSCVTLLNTAVEEIPDSIGNLDQLTWLTLSGSRVKTVSKHICRLEFLESLNLAYCPMVRFPEVPRNLKNLYLDHSQIKEVPSSISSLTSLSCLTMNRCTRLESLPTSICKLKSLEILELEGCSNLECFPEILETMESLDRLDLGKTAIKVLFSSKTLGLSDGRIPNIPSSFCNLVFLKNLSLSGSDIVEIPKSIKQLSNLIRLYLVSCKSLKSLPELPPHLIFLDAGDCTSLESVSNLEQFQHMKAHKYYIVRHLCFIFINCFKLGGDAVKNIVADAQLRIRCMVEEGLTEYYSVANLTNSREVFSCFPGSEIPETFMKRSTNSSVTVKLSPACSNKRFLGFILCVVVDFERHCEGLSFSVNCKYQWKTKCGDHHEFEHRWGSPTRFGRGIRFESSHVMFLFDGFESGLVETSRDMHFDEVSFEFYVHTYNGESLSVQKCGVNVFYADDVRSMDKETVSNTNYRSDDEERTDPTVEKGESSCHANLSVTRDEENRCNPHMLEPNSAIDPDRCDVNNQDFEGSMIEEDAGNKRSFSSDEEEDPETERAKYFHFCCGMQVLKHFLLQSYLKFRQFSSKA